MEIRVKLSNHPTGNERWVVINYNNGNTDYKVLFLSHEYEVCWEDINAYFIKNGIENVEFCYSDRTFVIAPEFFIELWSKREDFFNQELEIYLRMLYRPIPKQVA